MLLAVNPPHVGLDVSAHVIECSPFESDGAHAFTTSGADPEIFCPVMDSEPVVAGRKFGYPLELIGPFWTVWRVPVFAFVQSKVKDPDPVMGPPARPLPALTGLTVPVPDTVLQLTPVVPAIARTCPDVPGERGTHAEALR